MIVTIEPEVLMPTRNAANLRSQPRKKLGKEEWHELRERIRGGLKPGSWEEVYRMFGCSSMTGFRDRKAIDPLMPLDAHTVIWLSIFRQWCELYTGGHKAREWFFHYLGRTTEDRLAFERLLKHYGVLADNEQLPETFR